MYLKRTIFGCTNFREFAKIDIGKNSHNPRFMKISAREKKSNFENLNLPLNKILNSLILKILLSKNASISTLEVRMPDNFILTCLNKFSVTKIENFASKKICTRGKIKK